MATDFESKISGAIDQELKKKTEQPNVQLIMMAALVAAMAFQLYLRRQRAAARDALKAKKQAAAQGSATTEALAAAVEANGKADDLQKID